MSGPHTEDPATGHPAAHPGWCDRQHDDAWPVHNGDIGEVRLPAGTPLTVALFQDHSGPVEVWLLLHTVRSTDVVSMPLPTAHGLYDLLGDALTRAGVEL